MSYTPVIPESSTSAYNVNSYSATTGGGWSGNTFVGVGEQNDYNYVSFNLQVDETGTLTFQFSQDGVNWSSYPTTQFTIASGINEIHGAFKGTRWVRPVYTGNGGRSYFRLRTMYSYSPVTLTAPLNQPIGADQDATIVRSVGIGENPSGSYVNEKIDGVGFQTTDDLSSGATYNSAVLDVQGYTQLQTNIVSSNNGTLGFKFCSTSTCSGTTVGQDGVERYISLPYLASSGFQLYSAPAFTPYVQYSFLNGGTGTTTQMFYETKFLTKSLSGQLLGLNASISPSMVANLGRNVIVGQESDGTFNNVSVTETTNDSGTYYNLNVVSGARPSQLAGRTSVRIVPDITTNTLMYSGLTGNQKLYITDLLLTINNSSTVTYGRLNIRDGLSITGSTILPILTAEAPTNETAVSITSHTFVEPLSFDHGVFFETNLGTLIVTGILEGYKE